METFVVIPLITMGAPVLVALMVLRYRHLQTQARYRTLLELADKGVDLPAALVSEPSVPYSERRRALVLISSGIGLSVTLLALPGHFEGGSSVGSLWGLGLLPLITGLGYLTSWWLNQRGGTRG